jgi:hypothetical protein
MGRAGGDVSLTMRLRKCAVKGVIGVIVAVEAVLRPDVELGLTCIQRKCTSLVSILE